MLRYSMSVLSSGGKQSNMVETSWNVMAHGDAREGKWRGNWRMEWVASTLHTTSEPGASSITTADAHTSAASNRLNWRPRRFKWTRPIRRKKKSGYCAVPSHFKRSLPSSWVQQLKKRLQPTTNLRRITSEDWSSCIDCMDIDNERSSTQTYWRMDQ
jgi:hypothetical protein